MSWSNTGTLMDLLYPVMAYQECQEMCLVSCNLLNLQR